MFRRTPELVLTAAAAAAAAVPTVNAPDGRVFCFLVVVPNGELAVDFLMSLDCAGAELTGADLLATTGPGICAVEPNPAPVAAPVPTAPTPADPVDAAAAPGVAAGKPVPDGEYADLPDAGS